jgi:hypothetical protein
MIFEWHHLPPVELPDGLLLTGQGFYMPVRYEARVNSIGFNTVFDLRCNATVTHFIRGAEGKLASEEEAAHYNNGGAVVWQTKPAARTSRADPPTRRLTEGGDGE